MERFLKGECYVVVSKPQWAAFAEMCATAGIEWSGRRVKVSEYEPAPLAQGKPIRVIVAEMKMRWAPVSSPKSLDLPIIGFSRLKPLPMPEPSKAVITSDGCEITARLIADNRTVKTAKTACSPRDTYRFGPGALLALYRALETEEDRTLAMNLIAEDRIKQLEPVVPNIREIVGAPRKNSPKPCMDAIGDLIVKGLAEALKPLGAKVIVQGPSMSGSTVFKQMVDAVLRDADLAGGKK